MADTSRTQSDLLTNLFQDGQADGSITAQDMRDLIVSLIPSTGSGRFTSSAVVNITSTGVFTTPSSGTTALSNNTSDIDMPQNGRIRYTGLTDRNFLLSVSISATVAGNNQDLRFQLTKNGTGITESITSRTWGTGTDVGSLTILSGVVLSQNDYIEIQAANDTSTNDITITNGSISMHGHLT